MKTKVFENSTGCAAEIIRSGGIVAVPTETVYGLAGNGLDAGAVKKIYEVKGRPEIKPLALMVTDISQADEYCAEVPEAARVLAGRFWPGPLSIVLKARTDVVPDIVRAGGGTVSLRCPASPLTLKALEEAGVPFAAPSANPSGSPSPVNAREVLGYFDGEIDAVIDGGECVLKKESTIIDLSAAPYRILRQGSLPEKEIREALAGALRIIGITGQSGAGKTTALECAGRCEALVLDCDEVYHEMLASSEELISAIDASFPGIVSCGTLDRKKLAAVVFSDPEALERLNGVTHGIIRREIIKRLEDYAMEGGRLAALDAVELISSGLGGLCSATIAVTAGAETRVKRIVARDSVSIQEAERRVNAQRPEEYYRDSCTYCVENSSGREEFAEKIMNILSEVF